MPENFSKHPPLTPDAIRTTRPLFDHIADGVLVVDKTGQVLVFNRALEEITGLSATQVLDRPAGDIPVRLFAGRLEYPAGLAPPAELRADGGIHGRKLRLVTGDGRERWLCLRYQRMPASGGGGAAGLVRDITADEVYERARDRAHSPDNLGTFGYELAHEILGPLHSIDIQTQLLDRLIGAASGTQDEARRALDSVRDEVRRLSAMLKETLQLRRPERRTLGVVEPGALLAGVVELIQERAGLQGVEIELDASEGLPPLRIDGDRLQRAVLNLACNALEAMPEGGRLRLLAHGDSDRVRLTVADSGPGLPRSLTHDAFRMFFSTKAEGTGMGLPLARSIVEEHGGTLTSHRRERGAEFEISLPAS